MNVPAARADHQPGSRLKEVASYALIAAAIWLGWEVLKLPVAERAPPALAVRAAPTSPEVLRRAAEAELVANRDDNALALAQDSLARAPFNARALRVRGLAEARLGSSERADEMLTLAGNWSLRDDPTHAWLVENRLRRGSYGSAFAHADTLARRRPDLHPSLFRLFTTAAVQDPRAFPVLTKLLAVRPPWRGAFFNHLYNTEGGAPVVGALAIALEQTSGPFSTPELQQLYTQWAAAGRFAGIREVRQRLGRPALSPIVQNGDFRMDADDQFYPFGWTMPANPGVMTGIMEDDLRSDNPAFRLEYDGFGSGILTEQLVLIPPGSYTLSGLARSESVLAEPRVAWSVVCAETGAELVSDPLVPPQEAKWRPFRHLLVVPDRNCSAQWLRLRARPGNRRTSIVLWLDDLQITRASRETGASRQGSGGHTGAGR